MQQNHADNPNLNGQLWTAATSVFPAYAHNRLLDLFKDEIVPGPLNGMVVFSMEQQICGPLASRLLAEKGALVIKAEPPAGDSKRHNSTEGTFATFNVGKKSVVLDRSPESTELKRYLMQAADVVLDNRSKSARDSDSIYQELRSIKHATPKILAVISGYGQDSDRLAYDRSLQAEIGYFDLNGGKAIPNSPTDMAVGMMTANEILSYWSWLGRMTDEQKHDLREKQNNLIVCDVPMANVGIFAAMNQIKTLQDLGHKDSSIVPYGYFKTKDGHFAVAIGTDGQFQTFCKALGIEECAQQYPTNDLRRQHQDEVNARINAVMETRTNGEWVDFFAGKAFAYAPVTPFAQAIENYRHMQVTPPGADRTYLSTGVSTNVFPSPVLPASPNLGEHTARVASAFHPYRAPYILTTHKPEGVSIGNIRGA